LSYKEIAPVEETQIQEFDYSQVDEDTAGFLQEKANIIVQTKTLAMLKIAKELAEVNKRLANNYRGTFGNWCKSIGYSRDTAENYIRTYTYVAENFGNIEDAEKIKKSLLFLISKPSTPKELQEEVISGNITTIKEFEELKEQLKQKEKALEENQKRVEELNKANEKFKDELEKHKNEKEELTEELEEKNRLIQEMNNAPIEITSTVVNEPQFDGQVGISEVTIPSDVQQKLAQQESMIRELKTQTQRESSHATVLAKINVVKTLISEALKEMQGMDEESKKRVKEQLQEVLKMKV
jgi:predicted RNase H-like nuclease (RuvC/YqgF family)